MSSRTLLRFVVIIAGLLALNILIWRALLLPAPAGDTQQPAPPTRPATATHLPIATQPAAAPSPTPVTTAQPTPVTPAQPTPRAAMTPAPFPTRPQPSPTPALLTTFDQVVQAAQAGRRGVPFRLVFSEQEIGNEIAAYLQATPDLNIRGTQVILQPGVAIITGKARVLAFNVDFKATTTVVIAQGRPRLKVLQLDLLGGLIPGFIKDQLVKTIEQSADLPILADLPVAIDQVDIQQGQAVVTGAIV